MTKKKATTKKRGERNPTKKAVSRKSPGIARKKREFLKALRAKFGNVSAACEAIGVNRSWYYHHYESDPEFVKEVAEIGERNLDIAESKLLVSISEKNVKAISFYLERKGRSRGYARRQEITGADGTPLNTDRAIDYDSLPIELQEQLLKYIRGPKE